MDAMAGALACRIRFAGLILVAGRLPVDLVVLSAASTALAPVTHVEVAR